MALHGPIQVNGMTIGEWSAVRQTVTNGPPHADEVLTYDCTVHQDSAPDGCAAVLERFSVQHRFGDGALALAAAVLAKGTTLAKMHDA